MKTIVGVTVLSMLAASAAAQPEYNGPAFRRTGPALTDQLIVEWRSEAQSASAKLAEAGAAAGVRISRKARLGPKMDVVKLDRALARADLERVIAALAADPAVVFVVPDERRHAHATPTDPLFVEQWYFQSNETSATRAMHAWDVTPGSGASVVAVLDTGVRFEHPDLGRVANGGKLLDGYDFVTTLQIANDGDGRDADASDPGDWVSAQDAQQPPFNTGNCIPAGADHVDSSWHGTRVASLVGAVTNNAQGIAGSGWNTLILPVRVLGKCGGNDSDIIPAMRWAAGLTVPGVPANGNPAKIINLSLGAEGVCSAAYQSAVSEITARGVLIVASVGNEGGPVGSPANCAGVLGVTGLRHAGTKVGFSNLGPEAGLGAPGGNCVNTGVGQPCLFSIVVASNAGATTPGASIYTDRFNFNVGTSFSAPLVAGAAALMHAVNAQLSPANYISLLRETAAPFATSSTTTTTVCHAPASSADIQDEECICTTAVCGAGMLNTQAAVLGAQRPFSIVSAPSSIDIGTPTAISGVSSFASNGRAVASYQWSAVGVTGAAPTFADAMQASTTMQVAAASQFTLRLTVTDDQGGQDTADFAVATSAATPTPAPTPTPTPAPSTPAINSGGGGGGSQSAGFLALISAGALLRRRNQLRREIA